ncbi:YtxH domain-containing protein [Pedobacter sp. HMWF019]|uniref:YtxH domain-containing protein n=1 Tax=Pedobacter sp. HMWF019 TaxID=2056856 RepID=UPI000D3DB597|nr:YtxH domain-containing protein [Pedobacter sp. HMWF019]PTT00257.1 YtxH domain-containing protein [Pedobacter sp. HMWF019]
MKFNKLLSDCASRKTDSSLPIVALLAGLAVGAVVGILFAPESGENTRGKISDKAGDLAETVKDKLHSIKGRFSHELDEAADAKDEIVNKVKKKAEDTADKAKSAVKNASDDVNDAVQHS